MSRTSQGCWGMLPAWCGNTIPALDWVPPIVGCSASREVWVIMKDFPDKAGRSQEVADVSTCSLPPCSQSHQSFPSSQVPPVPLSAPRLLAKQSRQLVVSPVDSFSGDGPLTSIKLFYKPKDDNSAWSSIVGMCLQGWETQNLCGRVKSGVGRCLHTRPPVVMLRRIPVAGQTVDDGHGFYMSS